MPTPRLVAFDLDDTLAPSKGEIDVRIADLLRALLQRVDVAIISGGNEDQFRTQVIARLADTMASDLARLHLLPTCGTRYLRHDGAAFAACTTPLSLTGLADGSHTFQVRARDLAANLDPTPASYTWTIDTTAPDTTITSAPAALTNSSTASFTFLCLCLIFFGLVYVFFFLFFAPPRRRRTR